MKISSAKEMSKEDIKEVIKAFKKAAERANLANFDTIEIHAAHGYLINQFLSPLTNNRNDEYGNGVRFLQEILQEINKVWPKDKPIIVRVSADEFYPGGNTVEDIINVIKEVSEYIDIVDVSSGGVVNDAKINPYPGYQINYATKIKQKLSFRRLLVD